MIAGGNALLALLARAVRFPPWPGAAPAPAPAPQPAAANAQPAAARAAQDADAPRAVPPAVRVAVRVPVPVAASPRLASGLEALYRGDEAQAPPRRTAQSDAERGESGLTSASPREIERLAREHGEPQGRAIALGALFPPDAGATLCIRREDRKPPAGAAPPTHLWSARLQLKLPRLGEVALVVSVHEELARVSARAASAASRAELAAGAPLLAAALERNALVLERIEVAADDA
ncbi:MAG: flagellar hook-length control protein FliK [Pseudomonadota bacterium]